MPTVINASHIVAETFHDYGIHHLTCEFKTFQTKLLEPYRLSLGCNYFANDVYDSLSHPMLSISHFNSRQTTIAERLLSISRVHGGTYFKYTDFQYSTVDQLISKTIILYVSVITVPNNVTCHFNLRITWFQYMYQLLLKRLFITKSIREKYKRTKVQTILYIENTLHRRKIEMINAPLRI